eukprot:5403917-Alexandrium_andersonii.AAC.1
MLRGSHTATASLRRVGRVVRPEAQQSRRTKSGSGVGARVFPSDLGVRAARGAGCPISRAR